MVHLLNHAGQRLKTMEGLEGCDCVFVLGGDPFRYLNNKSGWDNSVVKWILLNDNYPTLEPKTYYEDRKKALSETENGKLCKVLSANWYIKYWWNKTGTLPNAPLKPDTLLDDILTERLENSNGLEERINLLTEILKSSWYCLNNEDRSWVCNKFFLPYKWSLNSFLINKSIESCKGYSEIQPYCGDTINDYIKRAKIVAVDLESDGKTIFQFGWKNSAGTSVCSNKDGISDEDLQFALKDCLLEQQNPCIVGHNILSWDLPILQNRKVTFPKSSIFWDTLIVSWLLAPWDDSHALVVRNNAHKADSDAEASYNLFNFQIAKLAPCLDGSEYDFQKLVDRIYKKPSLLKKVKGRTYPNELKSHDYENFVYPHNRIHEIAWQKYCYLKPITQENRLDDPILSSKICYRIAKEQNSIQLKVISIIVSDAESNSVTVRLTNLPRWLVNDNLRTILGESHVDYIADMSANMRSFYIAEDLFQLSEEEIESLVKSGNLKIAYPSEVIDVWQRVRRRSISEKDVRKKYPGVTENRMNRMLLPVVGRDGKASWLSYEPPGLGEKNASWSLLSDIPDWLHTEHSIEHISGDIENSIRIPRWRDGNASRLDVNRLFVSPDTANRKLYLSDLTHCLLNLVRFVPDKEVLLVAVRWSSEAKQMQANLVQLSFSRSHRGTPLRHIESILKEGKSVIVCDRSELSKYVQASDRLGINARIVIDEVPLYDWYAVLYKPDIYSKSIAVNEVDDITEASSDEEENNDSDYQEHKYDGGSRVVLYDKSIRELIEIFLKDWLKGLLKTNDDKVRSVIIMDARLQKIGKGKAKLFPEQDVPFYSIDEILDEDLKQIYYEVCFPYRENQPIQIDYEQYRLFLKENWGFDDFRPGTQRPAIEKLINTDSDILLRLPTGAGKSIIFHLPALLRSAYSGRLTVVITPLRALMRDQVQGLWQKGFTESVDYLSGGRDAWINYEVYQGILDGRIKLIFIAPERFRVQQFIESLERRRRMDGGLEFVVFDETHCVSEWGFEFRPDYLYAAQYVAKWLKRKELPGNPHRLLLTSATITKRNRMDLENELTLGSTNPYFELPDDNPHPIQPYIVLESCELHDEDEIHGSDNKFDKMIEIISGLDLDQSAALIFVKQRKECHTLSEALNEYAAKNNSGLESLRALPFHAGLPESVKNEACDLLRQRKVNILVCTKAFGMGMDIPHLHACIHHKPPTFIEDYLQEVGRIGRDEYERKKTGHEKVTATLLFNQKNIESNLTLLHDKFVKPPDLQDFFGYCHENSIKIKGIGRSICFIPNKVRFNESKEFDENKVANCIFWLERMNVLRVEGRHPPFIKFRLNLPKLRRYTDNNTLPVRIAKGLLNVVEESQGILGELTQSISRKPNRPETQTQFGRFIKGLLRGFFAIISPSQDYEKKLVNSSNIKISSVASKVDEVDASISISELLTSCDVASIDDLFSGFLLLSKNNTITVQKSLIVIRVGVPSETEFWTLLTKTIERLLQPTKGKVEKLSRKKLEEELRKWYDNHLVKNDSDGNYTVGKRFLTRRVEREVYRAIGTSLRMIRYAGVEIRENISSHGIIQYIRIIPDSFHSTAKIVATESIKGMKNLLTCVSEHEPQTSQTQDLTFEVPLIKIIEATGPEVRIGKLKELMKLVETAGFYGFEGDINDWVSLITLNAKTPLESYEPDSNGRSEIQKVYAEMHEKSEIQMLRAQAMVLYAAMPSENRKLYIDRYFDCVNAEDLEKLLEDTVGDVDEELLASNPILQSLLSQVRRERFLAEMEKLNENQLGVCKTPFDRTLLVNAGPGSGKTHVLMMRCAYLIHVQRIDPSEILVLAFNRAVVYEIRDRIRDLFHAIGYGSYANKLDVSTFHSFALRNITVPELYEEDVINKAVHNFAETMKGEKDFARKIGNRYKAILVDEFQDMNEDFYSVVTNLLANCGGGAMVIGDDDQDILTWNRRKWGENHGKKCSLEAVSYFEDFRKLFKPEEHQLLLNYRSVIEIVDRANSMIEKVSGKVGFSRMKSDSQLTAFRSENGSVEMPFNPDDCTQIVRQCQTRGGNIAILCRSNRECRRIYEVLIKSGTVVDNEVDLLGSEDFALYQLRNCGGLLDICRNRNEYDFIETYMWNDILNEYEQYSFADHQRDREYLDIIYKLVRSEVGRPRVRDIQNFIQEMRASDVERLKAKFGLMDNEGNITIATVHKVKGLEFDTVILMPSSESFPFTNRNGFLSKPEKIDSAEEARLYYVAMTRARNRLYIGWEEREKKWIKCEQYKTKKEDYNYILKGSPDELYVSWTGQIKQVQKGLQEYIKKQVFIGDPIVLNNKELLHRDIAVGYLANKSFNRLPRTRANLQLRVSNVLRYTCGQYFRENKPKFWNLLDESVKRRGWFYLVLVEECL